ncbi:uncharacterized protein N0V89_004887 [Didymosphaeria variabile]|uniref:Heterokaryon incompatibility domain-containing protein n=1 Tax=Didymosphaeria variabile TaxID=1932322 RepID=A0A9W8XQ91_9PLEO|nr:uncharacterized protein N0V89_004887 [Didymosphaeria variabile]KAJ4356850.1 hypothetical protein N0V89_004887 [Didymosphaeria variabile]
MGIQKREEIRLLDVEPANQLDDPLRAILRHAELQDAHFSALSYVWGDTVNDRSNIAIRYERSAREYLASKLRGKSAAPTYVHSIGSNLARALRHLRQKYGRLTIWTDALCINQGDGKEKDWQVPLMKAIYSQAQEVHAWLGPLHNEDVAAIRNMKAAIELANAVWTLAAQIIDSISLLSEEDWLEACFTVADAHQSYDQTHRKWADFAIALRRAATSDHSIQNELACVRTLSQNTYFARMWILQETGRARRLTFHFGLKDMPHRPVLLALSLANSLREPKGSPETGNKSSRFDTRFLGCLSARTTCMQKRSLRDVLASAYFSPPPLQEASDPKDLIYARLGLAENPHGITVEYGLSVAEVYTAASRFLLSEGFLEILVTFRPYRFQRGIIDESFPSWAYDWSKKAFNSFDKYTASRDTSQKVSIASYRDARFKHVLTMTGINIGTVQVANKMFSATVLAAGLHKGTVGEGSIRAVSEELSPEKKDTLVRNITSAYRQLGIIVADADIETLLSYRTLPFASFWCWWVHWIASLVNLMNDTEAQQPDKRLPGINVAELLFREDPGVLNRTENMMHFGTKTGILALIDYQRWVILLGIESERSGIEESMAIQFAESLFRSAWGMRPASLNSRRLGYVPEDTRAQDEVVIFHGVKAPLVIRKTTPDAYRIIGPAHICGAMQGELMDATLSGTTYKLI